MRKAVIGKRHVELYDSIDDLPILRFHKYNKLMLIDSGVGSDLRDINTHISRIQGFLKKDPDLASKELENLRQNMYLIAQELNPKHLAFAALVKSIDGKEQFDLSDEGLRKVTEQLSKENVYLYEKLIAVLKKKLTRNLTFFSRTNSKTVE